MTYPEIKWAQLTMRNPDRRWWQFWKPKRVLMGDRLIDVLNQHNELLQDVVWVDTRMPPADPVPTLTDTVEELLWDLILTGGGDGETIRKCAENIVEALENHND